MKEVKEIKSFWNVPVDYDIDCYGMWEGKFILDDDGWFEGIVKNEKENDDRMIFGIYNSNNSIEFIKLADCKKSDPYIYHCIKNKKFYYGTVYSMRTFGEVPKGDSEVIVKDTLYNELEVKDLLNKIKLFKQNNNMELYDNLHYRKKEIAEYIKNNPSKIKILEKDYSFDDDLR